MNPIEKLMQFENPDAHTIPSISLYMDQLLEYFESALGDLKRQDEDTVLTKTMINNYVKSGLIKAPERKKYDKETISDLIVVYHMKKAFSIQDTSRILDTMKENQGYYEQFVTENHQIREEMLSRFNVEPESLDREKALVLLKQLSIEVSIKKQLAEQLIDYLSSTMRVQK